MSMSGRIVFVMPAYEEEACIESVVRRAFTYYPDACVAVVNDRSPDDTGRRARVAGAVVIDMPFNSGYGAALHTGLCWAQRRQAEIVITLDADGQHDPREICHLLDPVQSDKADLVLGSRYREDGAQYPVPATRRAGSWLFAQVTSALIGKRITDPTSGFQCMNRKALDLFCSVDDFPEKTPDADLILLAHLSGLRVQEVAVRMYADQGAGSMHGLWKSLSYAPKMLVAMAGVLLAGQRVR
jgi:glycosyltransferase involved in cell wall biosynthesis